MRRTSRDSDEAARSSLAASIARDTLPRALTGAMPVSGDAALAPRRRIGSMPEPLKPRLPDGSQSKEKRA